MSETQTSKNDLDQRFEARVAHLVGMAESWGRKGGPSTPELDQAIRELREYFYRRNADDASEGVLTEVLKERDRYQDYADELARCISEMTGVEIGEHSNLNNPWEEALEAAAAFLASRSTAVETPATHWRCPSCSKVWPCRCDCEAAQKATGGTGLLRRHHCEGKAESENA